MDFHNPTIVEWGYDDLKIAFHHSDFILGYFISVSSMKGPARLAPRSVKAKLLGWFIAQFINGTPQIIEEFIIELSFRLHCLL